MGAGAAFTWLAGRQGDGPPVPRRLFIYHLPKTGTSTVFNALRAALHLAFADLKTRQPGFAPPLVARLDDDRDPAGLDAALLASHRPFGLHARLAHPAVLLTVLRDPVARIQSSYTYDSMRRARPVTEAAYRDHLRRPENVNAMTRQLAGLPPGAPVGPADLDRALGHLRNHVTLYGTSRHIPALCEAYLRWCRLPNVVVDRINRTEPAYRLPGTPFAEEVAALNVYDRALHLFARDRPRLAVGDSASPGAPHPWTALVVQGANDAAVRGTYRALPTDRIPEPQRRREFDPAWVERLFPAADGV